MSERLQILRFLIAVAGLQDPPPGWQPITLKWKRSDRLRFGRRVRIVIESELMVLQAGD